MHEPINVCMVSHSYYDTDNRVMRYAETLAQRGDHVDVLSLRLAPDEPDALLNGVNVIRIQTRSRDQRGRGAHLFPVLTFLARAAWYLTKRHRQKPYDLIHVHSVPDFMVFAALFPKLTGTKVILDIHDILPELYASKFTAGRRSIMFALLLLVERLSSRFADHVIIANDVWRSRLLARSISSEKCTSILNFPDRSIFHKNGAVHKNGEFVILYPGSLNHHQGLDIALRAFGRICKQVPYAQFQIYGRGPERQRLINLADELHLGRQFALHDCVPLREMATLMEAADVGIVPKRGDSFGDEAFSTKTLEFMSLGVPIVVSATTVDRYYFNDSLVRFFRCGDEEDLSKALIDVITHSELRSTLVRNGLQFAIQNDWEHHRSKYLTIVDSLAPAPSR